MYNNKFVVSCKVNGKIVREDGDIVHLPFNNDYSLFLKNLNSRKALVNVEIDGIKVASRLLVDSNRGVDLDRFLDGYSRDNGPKFRFIEKTQAVSNFRGDKAEDGIIRVSFTFEQEPPLVRNPFTHNTFWVDGNQFYGGLYGQNHINNYPGNQLIGYASNNFMQVDGQVTKLSSVTTTNADSQTFKTASVMGCLDASPSRGVSRSISSVAKDGITAKGDVSNQQFIQGYIGRLENIEHVICLKVMGFTPSKEVPVKSVYVDTSKKCNNCGRTNKGNAKFCSQCGSGLVYK